MHLTGLCMHVQHALPHDITDLCMQLLHELCCFEFISDIISSYFGGKALSVEPNIYSGLANKTHKFWCIEVKIGKTLYIYPFTEVEKLLKF
jgi:hypothetical protein